MNDITITRIKIVKSTHGPDTIILTSTLPPTEYPFTENATFKLIVARDTGEQYVKDNFTLQPEIIS